MDPVRCPINNLQYCRGSGKRHDAHRTPEPTHQLTVDEGTQLKSLAASATLPHALVCRAKVVLWSAPKARAIPRLRRLGWAKATVGKRRQRLLEQRVAGPYDELRRGDHAALPMSKIDDFVQHYHRRQRAFIWTATAHSILQKIARLCSRISKTRHQPALFYLPDAVVSVPCKFVAASAFRRDGHHSVLKNWGFSAFHCIAA